jgi:exonuclease III
MFKWILFFSLLSTIITADTECPIVNSIGDRRKDKSKLRLVQYNVEWLFIDYYSGMDCPGNGCTWKNLTEAQTHMDYVSKRIKVINPDIINFCEVEGCDELNMLKDKLDGSYVPYLKKGTDTGTGQNVGMLTRIDPLKSLYRTELKYNYPIAGSKCGYTGSVSSSGVSKHYITEFNFNEMNVAFISAHLIAIPTDSARCAQREAQASVLQTVIADYVNKEYEVIMIGDFNDYDSEILDMNSDKPTSSVLDILKGLKGDYAGKYQLFNIAETIVQSERYSDWWDSDNNCNTASKYDYSMIDHILVTDLIRKNIVNTFIYHEYNEYCGKYDSDHYPVVVDLMI